MMAIGCAELQSGLFRRVLLLLPLPVGCDHDYPLYAEEQACIVTAKSWPPRRICGRTKCRAGLY